MFVHPRIIWNTSDFDPTIPVPRMGEIWSYHPFQVITTPGHSIILTPRLLENQIERLQWSPKEPFAVHKTLKKIASMEQKRPM